MRTPSTAGLLRFSLASLLLLLCALAGCAGGSSNGSSYSGGSSTPSAPTLRSIAVTGAATSLLTGATQALTATATYSDNSTRDVTSAVTWSSSSTAIATVSATGTVTAVAAGSTVLTATLSGISGTFSLTVTAPAPTLRSITVTGAATSLLVGATQTLTATANYSDSSTKDITATATWTTSSSAVTTVSATGVVTAIAAGNAVLTASQSGISGTFALTVTAPTLVSLEVKPAGGTVYTGRTQQYSATGRYSDNSTKDVTASATWSSNAAAIATITASGLLTGVAPGSATIQATYLGVSGSTGVTVASPPPLSVTAASAAISTTEAARNQLNITVKDQNGSPISGAAVTWTTSSGWLFPVSSVTDANGNAAAAWVAGPSPSATLSAAAVSNSSTGKLDLTATIGKITTNASAPYFDYFLPNGADPDGFRNTVTPLTDPPSTFYAAVVFDGGYTGMQRTGSLFDRQLHFSMADDATGGNAEVIDRGVSTCVRYSGEGTGWACASSYPWVVGQKYTFTVTTVNGATTTDYTATMLDVTNNVTVNLGTLRLHRIANQHGVLYSFIEQFSLFNPSCLQTALRKVRTTGAYREGGQWLKYASGYFAYSNAVGNCDNMNYGVENGETFFSTGGTEVGDVPATPFYVPLP